MKFKSETGSVDLAVGSGMLRWHDGALYLITNWHNITGCHVETHKPLHRMKGVPNEVSIRLALCFDWPSSGGQRVRVLNYDEPKFVDHQPRWYEHPTHGSKIDVIALKVSSLKLPLNDGDLSFDRLFTIPVDEVENQVIVAQPGLDCFIIGFPLGISGGGNLPIWKRASIASEPNFDECGLPRILVDSATREGLSGSPVFIAFNGFLTSSGFVGADASRDLPIQLRQLGQLGVDGVEFW
jgi:hypothetical protein